MTVSIWNLGTHDCTSQQVWFHYILHIDEFISDFIGHEM